MIISCRQHQQVKLTLTALPLFHSTHTYTRTYTLICLNGKVLIFGREWPLPLSYVGAAATACLASHLTAA